MSKLLVIDGIPVRFDLRDQRFGLLTVIRPTRSGPRQQVHWLCRCICGREQFNTSAKLKAGARRGCISCISNTTDQYIGRVFGRLTVIGEGTMRWHEGANRRFVRCRCECGREIELTGYSLTRNTQPVKSCGCARRGSRPHVRKPIKPLVVHRLFRDYTKRARRNHIEFSITLEDFANLVTAACGYCGSAGTSRVVRWRDDAPLLNGLDRINPGGGYTMNNVESCCSTCNFMKTNLSRDVFLQHVAKIVAHQEENQCHA